MKIRGQGAKTGETRYIYDKADYDAMYDKIMEIDWNNEFWEMSMERSWSFFKTTLLDIFNRYTPKKTINVGQRKKHWMNRETLEVVREKHRHFRKWQEMKSEKNREKYYSAEIEQQRRCYSRSSNQARWQCRKAVSSYEKYIASGVKKNARAFWSYVNSKITTRESVCNLTKPDGSKTETDQEKAEVLQDFFSSVFTKEDLQDIPLPSDVEFDTPLDDIPITSGDVFESTA